MKRGRAAALPFLLPLAALLVVLGVFPLLWSLAASFAHFSLGGPPSFAGLANYERLLGDYRFWNALRVTLTLAAAATVAETALGFGLAVLLHETGTSAATRRRGSPGQALLVLPFFMAPVALGYLGLTVFHEEAGPLALALRAAGLPAIPWLSEGRWALASCLIVDLWAWTPFCFLILHAALQAQPPDLFEAARLEPLTRWQRVRWLHLPLLRPAVGLVLILRFVEALKTVDVPFALTGGGPAIATETLGLYAYRATMKFGDFGYGSAVAYALFALVMVAVQAAARVLRPEPAR